MEHVSNEQKAKEIAEKIVGNDHYSYFDDFKLCALQAMELKDEQFEKERQQLIDEACEWLARNDSYAIPTNVQVDRLREHLNNIK